MDLELIEIINREISENRKVCYAMIINQAGSSPRSIGTAMVIKDSGEIFGTVGGGTVEYKTILEAKKCIAMGISKTICFDILVEDGNETQSMGKVDIFLKTYIPYKKLIIAGAGHVAYSLYKLAVLTGFSVVVFDNRENLLTRERYPKASELIYGEVQEEIRKYTVDKDCYIVIASGSTALDEAILKEVISKEVAYIGVLGSQKKIKTIFENLKRQDIDNKFFEKVYAPIGIAIGGETPEEVALSILTEIVMLKNNGELRHMKQE